MEMEENVLERIEMALANLDAAFPAGDYGLNKRQNLAINELLDISFEMSHRNSSYKKKLEDANRRVDEERNAEIWRIAHGCEPSEKKF